MSSYTITIAPNDDSGNTTTLVVNTAGGQVSITDIHLHSGGGLTGGKMPTVDFGLLLQAVNATTTAPTIEASPEPPSLTAAALPEPVTSRPPRTRGRISKAAPEPAPEAPARRGRGGRARGEKAAASRAAKAAAAPKKAGRKATKAAAGSGERAYRRMPDDFAAVYEQTGSAAATAEYYGVPRYSVHGWIRRIKATTPPAAE